MPLEGWVRGQSARAAPGPREPRRWRGRRGFPVLASTLELVLALGALGGGLALMLGPRGDILHLPVSALSGSPFDTYFVPGLMLFSILGLGPLVVAGLAWRGNRSAPALTSGVGAALLVWIAVEIVMVGYTSSPPLQAVYLILGVALALIGGAWGVRRGAT